MAADMFLKIDGIKGESSMKKHEGEIELLSFSWGLQQSASSGGGGGGSGKVQVKEFTFVKMVDVSTPKLMEACCSGQHIHEVNLTLANKGAQGSQVDYLKIKFSDVLISSYQTGGGSAGSVPMDQVSFAFGSIQVSATGNKGELSEMNCNFASDIIFKEQGHEH